MSKLRYLDISVLETNIISKNNFCTPKKYGADTFIYKLAQLSPLTIFDFEPSEFQPLTKKKTKKIAKNQIANNFSNLNKTCKICCYKRFTGFSLSKYDHLTRVRILKFKRGYNNIRVKETNNLGYGQHHTELKFNQNLHANTFYDATTINHGEVTNAAQIQADKIKLEKKAAAKFFTNNYVQHLIELESPLKKSYISTLDCATQLSQNGYKITSKYCKQRWCNVCNRIRTAKLMNGYLPQLNTFTDGTLLTLTVKNCTAENLPKTIEQMNKVYRFIYKKIYKKLKVQKANKFGDEHFLKGLKKIECTYNFNTNEYHPHYHLILANSSVAKLFYNYWYLHINSTGSLIADLKGQDLRPINYQHGGAKELFKYFTKIMSKTNEYEYITKKIDNSIYFETEKREKLAIVIPAMDVIFSAMRNKRVYEPIGIRAITEDINELNSDKYSHLIYETCNWEWNGTDWQNDSKEDLTGYEPSKELKQIISNIIF
jgi:hypothetical protein